MKTLYLPLACLTLFGCWGDLPSAPRKSSPPQWVSVPIPELPAKDVIATGDPPGPGDPPGRPYYESGPSTKTSPLTSPLTSPSPSPTDTTTIASSDVPTDPQATIDHRPSTIADAHPTRITYWDLFRDPEAISLELPTSQRLQEDRLKDTSYPHPFLLGRPGVSPLMRRQIAVDHKAKNWDMRDALLVPLPSSIRITVPPTPAQWLSLSHLVVPQAFAGKAGSEATVTVAFVPPEAPGQHLATLILDLKDSAATTTWTEIEVPLTQAQQGGILEIHLEGNRQDVSQGVAIGHVRLTGQRPGGDQAPNFLILFLDAARGDSTGPGNESFPSVTPHMDEFAKTGTAFVNAFSVGNQTRASITAFLQGQPPIPGLYHSRFWFFPEGQTSQYYQGNPPLVTRLLQQQGYHTVSIGRNNFQFATDRMGLDPGFQVIWDNQVAQLDTVNIINRSIQWLQNHKEDQFFLVVNISPAHQPYNPPEEFLKRARELLKGSKQLPALVEYLAELLYADTETKRLLDTLQELGLRDSTVVIITADHGEVMHRSHYCRSELFQTICHNSHGLTLYDEETHVPLMVVPPPLLKTTPGIRRNAVSHLSIAATIMELAGARPHPAHVGRSLVPDLRGEDRPDDVIFAQSRLSQSLRKEGWKLITHHRNNDARTPAWLTGPANTTFELYNVHDDPFETKNLAGTKRQTLDRLLEDLQELTTTHQNYVDTNRHAPPRGEAEPAATPPREQSEPAATPPREQSEPPPYLTFALNPGPAPTRFTGRITVQGNLLKVETLGEMSCIRVLDSRTIELDCLLTEESRTFRFQPDSPRPDVVLALEMDQKPLTANQLYSGKYGLHLLDETALLSRRDYQRIYSPRAPNFVTGIDPGVFWWSDRWTGDATRGTGTASSGDDEFTGEAINDGAAREVLKSLGYWQ